MILSSSKLWIHTKNFIELLRKIVLLVEILKPTFVRDIASIPLNESINERRHSNLSLMSHCATLRVSDRSAISLILLTTLGCSVGETPSLEKLDTETLFSNSFIGTDVAGTTGVPDESTTITLDKPCSPSETSTTVATAAAPSSEQEEQQPLYQYHTQHQQQQRAAGNIAAAASHVAEDSGASYEMRRTPPQNKGKFFLSFFKN